MLLGGWGGSFNLFNPEKKLTVSYCMNAMGNHLLGGPRTNRLWSEIKKVA